MATFLDVTSSFHDLLQADSSLFDFIQSSAIHGLWVADLSDSSQYWGNPALWVNLGYDPFRPEFTPPTWSALSPEAALPRAEGTNTLTVRQQNGLPLTMQATTRLCALPNSDTTLSVTGFTMATGRVSAAIQATTQSGAPTPDNLAPQHTVETLKSELDLLQTIINSVPINIYVKDTQSRKVLVNRAEYEYMGAGSASEVLGKDDTELFPDESARQSLEEDQLVVTEGQSILGKETLNTRLDGSQCWFLTSKIPLRNSEGTITGLLGISIDITSRKQAELKLQRMTEMLEQTSLVAKVGGWEVDVPSQAVFWSPITKEIHELPADFEPDLATGINFYKEGESRERINEVIKNCIEQGKPWDVELQLITATGREVWVRAIGKGEFHNGKCVRLFGTFQDIDKRKKNEKRANESALLLKKLSDRVPGCLYQFHQFDDGRFTFPYASVGIFDIFELTPEAVMAKPTLVTSRIHPDDYAMIRNSLVESRDTLSMWVCDFRVLLPSRGERWIRVEAVPERLADSVIWYGFFQDISIRKQSEQEIIRSRQQAEEANQSKSEFLANMSHEIRTPLNGVIGFTDLLMRTKLDATQQEYMSTVYHSANSLLDIINDILDFSKIEAGKLDLAPEKTDLFELGSQVADMIKYQAHKKGLEMLLNISSSVPRYIWADPIRLRQILVNLLGNAVKFTREGEIELRVETLPGGSHDEILFRFSVRDTGIGIAPQNRLKIFEAFSQADTSTTRKFGGTGLGLTISNKLLGLMDSQLQLESEVDEGSTFFFDVTFRGETGEPMVWTNPSNIKSVLIVDDNANNRLILQDMLALEGIKAEQASNGIEALERLRRKTYDVILMDYHMPYLDGIDTIRKIRRDLNRTAEQQPIALLGSSADDAYVEAACAALHVQQHLMKPIKIQQLYNALSQLNVNVAAPVEPDAPAHTATVLDESPKARLLIVEDNPINMMLASAILRHVMPGVHIMTAENGRQGVNAFVREQPDLIFMDIQMPEMNGYEATAAIRELDNGRTVPIIALTAGTLKSERERCLEAGMNDYITKPVVRDTIERVLNQWLLNRDPAQSVAQTPQPPTPPADTTDHFNRAELITRLGGDEEFIRALLGEVAAYLDSFVESSPQVLTLQDLPEMRAMAHKLKGTALNMSFKTLADLASQLEDVLVFDKDKISTLLAGIEAEIGLVKSLIGRP